jgi:hypothetical protein
LRKITPALLVVAALAACAQPAAADDAAATTSTVDHGNGVTASCATAQKAGEAPQSNPWGTYIDGCTVRLACPAEVRLCAAKASSRIVTETPRGHHVTLDQHLRAFSGPDTVDPMVRRDLRCDGTDACSLDDSLYLNGGQAASVQCNGIRQTADNRAMVGCSLDLQYIRASTAPAPAPPPAAEAPAAPTQRATVAPRTATVVPGLGLALRAVRHGRALVRVTCPAGAGSCAGRLTARLNGVTLKATRFALAAGGSRLVAVPVGRRHGLLRIRVADARELRRRV